MTRRFVLDASVTMTWLLADAKGDDARFVESMLDAMRAPDTVALVPAIWSLEVANVLARAESRGLLTEAQSRAFLALLAALPIQLESGSADAPFGVILELARRYRLSSYDAAYLELALRTQSPLASIDRALRSAAVSAGVALTG